MDSQTQGTAKVLNSGTFEVAWTTIALVGIGMLVVISLAVLFVRWVKK